MTTDLSDADKNRVWIQISVNFCTISSDLSCLLGRAMSIADWVWGFDFSYCLTILVGISPSFQFWRSTSYLFSRFCTQNIPRSYSKNFSELADDFWSIFEFEVISVCLDILMEKDLHYLFSKNIKVWLSV